MPNVWRMFQSKMRRDRASEHWKSILADPASSAVLHQTDENVEELQQSLQTLSHYNVSFASSIMLFNSRICTTTDHDMLLSYIRTVIEIFILYSINTANIDWVDRAHNLSRRIENLSRVRFQKSQLPPAVDHPTATRHCLRASTHLKLLSRIEQFRAEIIEEVVDLSEGMPSEMPLVLYNDEIVHHRRNAETFAKKLKISGHYWIAMAYCLAVEPVEENKVQQAIFEAK